MNDDDILDTSKLDSMTSDPLSDQLDGMFKDVSKDKLMNDDNNSEAPQEVTEAPNSELNEFEIDLGGEELSLSESPPSDDGLELSLNNVELEESETVSNTDNSDEDQLDELSLDDLSNDNFSLDNEDELSLDESFENEITNLGEPSEELNLDSFGSEEDLSSVKLDEVEDSNLGKDEGLNLNLEENNMFLSESSSDFSDDAKKKLEEIDAIMDHDATQASMRKKIDQNESLVPEDLNLESINFPQDVEENVSAPNLSIPKKRKAEAVEITNEVQINLGKDLKEISGAFSGEIERLQVTISNLRTDREELLSKIQKFEEEKLLNSRQNLSLRAELDEKKIELLIMRKKLNEEIIDLKDKLKLHDEKRLILEEKNKILSQEIDKLTQKNKIDVKKVQLRERELEQKLELLKSDAETQIKHRDLKILELKRKIDAMEFDMESLSLQEKKSVESRYELEDKLEKAIKTLKTAITVLEDDQSHTDVLKALKKNIDM